MPLFRRHDPANDLAPGYLAHDQQEFLRGCADMGDKRINGYQLFEEYYDGEQRTVLIDRAREYLEASGLRFAENFCDVVVDVLAERLKVVSFQVTDNDEASDWLNSVWWSRNRLDEVQGVVHTETPKLGDGFLFGYFDEKTGLPRARWNHPRCVKPVYDEDGSEMLYVCKVWSTDRVSPSNPDGRLVMRLNIYRPDRVEKWFSFSGDEASTWQPWTDVAGEQWPVAWTESGRIPSVEDPEQVADDALGIPLVHFRNKPKGRRFGRSEIRGAIPYQDQLNKQVVDLFQVMDAQGFQWPYITGLAEDTDITLAIGDIIKVGDAAAKVGMLEAADPRPMLNAIDKTLNRLAAKTGTPLFELTPGAQVSGESRKMQESRLTHKGEDRQVTFGNSWEDAARLAWRLGGLYGQDVPAFDPEADITVVWESVETRDDVAEAATLEAHYRLGASKATILRKLGYDPEEEADARAEEAEAAAEAAQRAFDRGAGGGPPYSNGGPPRPPFGGGER